MMKIKHLMSSMKEFVIVVHKQFKKLSPLIINGMTYRYSNAKLYINSDNELVCKIKYFSKDPEFDKYFEEQASERLTKLVIRYG